MNNHRLPFNHLFHALVFACGLVAVMNPATAYAKDTDIYLKMPQVSRDDAPNIMILLDNSGSMDADVSTVPSYDATITHTGSYDTTRVYWSTDKSLPSSGTSRWLPATDNKCASSLVNLGSSAGATGYYSDNVIGWIWKASGGTTSTTQGRWNDVTSGTNSDGNRKMGDIECANDNPADATLGTYATASNNSNLAYASRYTNDAGDRLDLTAYNNITLFSGNYLNYKSNPPASVTKSRMLIAKEAINTIIDSNRGVRFGLMVFNYNNTTPHGGRVLMRIDSMTDERRATMKALVNNITASTWTPLAESLWEAYRYFSGGSVDYGNPSPAQAPEQDSCAQDDTSSYCDDGEIYNAISGQHSVNGVMQAGTADSTYNDGSYISPFKYGCQKAYVLIITDGAPTIDDNADANIKALTGTSCAHDNDDATSSCLKDLAGYMLNNDVYSLGGNQSVSTYTVGFGSGIGPEEQQLLNDTAENGGTRQAYFANNAQELSTALQNAVIDAVQTNSSFSSPSLSVNAFNRLFNRDEIYFALFKPSTSQGWDGNIKKFKLCNTSDVTAYSCVFGDVIDSNNKTAIDSNSKIKNTAVSYWGSSQDGASVTAGGAGAHVTTPRTLHTYLGSYAGLSSSTSAPPVAIDETESTNTVYTAAINDPTILGLPDTSPGGTSDTNAADTTAVTGLISWMRGTGRSWNFADPLHSRPVALTFGAELTASVPDPDKPIIKLFVGTNDGMIRIINNSTGAEEWAFIPQELLPYQASLSTNDGGEHIIGVDDTPSFWINDVNNDAIIDKAAGDFVYMYIGMRRGVDTNGDGYIYAFDVTPATKMTLQSHKITPELMWVIKGGTGDFAKLGQTWSRPKFTRIRTKCTGPTCNTGDSASRPVLIFGGGYSTNQDTADSLTSISSGVDTIGNAIYIVDPYTGARIWWASSDTSATLVLPKMNFSIPSELTVTDTNGDGWTDRIYVGDTGGQIWRIDISDQLDTDTNGSSAGYVFADVGCGSTGTTTRVHDTAGNCPTGTTNQARRKFFFPPDVAQVEDTNFSSISKYDLVTIASGDREDPLDLLTSQLTTTATPPVPAPEEPVHNRLYAFRDYNYQYGPPTGTVAAITETTTDLYDATANNLGTFTGAALDDEIAIVKAKKGFYIDLVEEQEVLLPNGVYTKWVGEKGLAKTVIFGGVLYATTYVPANDLTALQTCAAAEGQGRVYAVNYLSGTPVFNLTGDSTLDRFKNVGGGIPSEPVIVIREGGVTGLVGTSGGAASVTANTTGNKYRTYWYDE
jgi:type IV pilus assembly protein PilY1